MVLASTSLPIDYLTKTKMILLTETLEPSGTVILLVTNKTTDKEIEQDENNEVSSSKGNIIIIRTYKNTLYKNASYKNMSYENTS